jgi:hypothetical protein
VSNFLERVQAREAVVASDNYIESLYSLNMAMVSFARAMSGADLRLTQLLGGK